MLGLGSSLISGSALSSVENVILSLFKKRVREDSGDVEDGVCLEREFTNASISFNHRQIRSRFRKRVVSEGYVDDVNCLTSSLKSLDKKVSADKAIRNRFRDRVVADGGYVDDVNCLTLSIQDIT